MSRRLDAEVAVDLPLDVGERRGHGRAHGHAEGVSMGVSARRVRVLANDDTRHLFGRDGVQRGEDLRRRGVYLDARRDAVPQERRERGH